MIVFLHILKTTSFVCTGVTSIFVLENGNLQLSRSSMCIFIYKKNDMKHYLNHILKSDTSSGDMNEKVDHWLDSFEKFYKKYIIMPSQLLNYSFLENILFITVQSPPDFINK